MPDSNQENQPKSFQEENLKKAGETEPASPAPADMTSKQIETPAQPETPTQTETPAQSETPVQAEAPTQTEVPTQTEAPTQTPSKTPKEGFKKFIIPGSIILGILIVAVASYFLFAGNQDIAEEENSDTNNPPAISIDISDENTDQEEENEDEETDYSNMTAEEVYLLVSEENPNVRASYIQASIEASCILLNSEDIFDPTVEQDAEDIYASYGFENRDIRNALGEYFSTNDDVSAEVEAGVNECSAENDSEVQNETDFEETSEDSTGRKSR